jgi:hypothetical protein
MTSLTKHFTFEELYASDIAARYNINNKPTDSQILNNLQFLAERLEDVRSLLQRPIHVNSAYRCLLVNGMLGSKPTSAHVKGLAADIICPSFGKPSDIVHAIIGSDIQYDQVILEYDRWCHIGFADKGQKPRLQKLIIDSKGTRNYA